MNYLQDVAALSNTYYAFRHGRSLANRQQLIISHPDDGVPSYGLTEEGRQQAARAVAEAQRSYGLDRSTIIVSSDFARARETAAIAASILGVPTVITTPLLRERFFGEWDKHDHSHYHTVWSDDLANPDHKHYNVESTSEVLARATALVRDLEQTYSGKNILLVSHGDTLQILQTAFERVPSSQHRSIAHIETGEIRKLQLQARAPAA